MDQVSIVREAIEAALSDATITKAEGNIDGVNIHIRAENSGPGTLGKIEKQIVDALEHLRQAGRLTAEVNVTADVRY